MKETIVNLLHFQLQYLRKLVENVPGERLYEKQLEGFNSAGWILGHIAVEAEDVFAHLKISYKELDPDWAKWFRNTTGKIESLDGLPTRQELLEVIDERYRLLGEAYLKLSPEQRTSSHPSRMLRTVLSNTDSWFAHHLTTHIAMHCGNIVVWKKMIGIPVAGY